MLRDPLSVKNVLLTTFGPKKVEKTPFAKTKIPLEPLDLLATVDQTCVCVNVSLLVSVCVCVVKNDVVVLWR